MIRFFDSTKENNELIENGLMKDIENVIRKGNFYFGEKTQELENKLSEYFNSNAITVGNGTEAIYLALKAFGIGKGSRVAIPTISAIPTAAAVFQTGAEIVYVDVNTNTVTMDFLRLKEEKNIDAVVFVHLYGIVVEEIKAIAEYCKKNNIILIEDCAQSFSSKNCYGLSGIFGNAGTFSFYSTKTLGGFGDAGCVISKSLNVIEKIRELRFYGQKSRYIMGNEFGINSRTDEIQASILLKKLENFENMIQKRQQMLLKYKRQLEEKGVWVLNWYVENVPHLFPILVNNRNVFINKMKREKNIETIVHYPFTLPSLCKSKYIEQFSGAEFVSSHIVSIPFHTSLTEEEINYIINSTIECFD